MLGKEQLIERARNHDLSALAIHINSICHDERLQDRLHCVTLRKNDWSKRSENQKREKTRVV